MFLKMLHEETDIVWTKNVLKVWETPIDASVKMSIAATVQQVADYSANAAPDHPNKDSLIQRSSKSL
jgi:hypothetical protein